MNRLQSLLQSHEYLIADGGLGTMLMATGLEHGDPPEEWNVLHPDRVEAVHRRYIEAGAQIVLTNSFGGSRFRLKLHQLQDRAHELNCAAAQVACAAVAATDYKAVVAGSMGPSGEILHPLGELAFDDAVAGFAEQAAALTEGGADVLWIETMSDLKEVQAAVEGAQSASTLPVVITMTFDTNGRTMMGVSPEQALDTLRPFQPIAVGGNCGNGPAEIEGVIQAMYATDQTMPLVAKSNAGIPELIDGEAVYSADPSIMADYAIRVRNMGATIIGACCGSTPAHVQAMVNALESTNIDRIDPKTAKLTDAKSAPRERRRTRTRRVSPAR